MRRTSIVPSAHRLMNSLRDLGYELPQAIAELVDNSIDADASEVWVDVCFSGADSWIRVSDNGRGMTPRGLEEAMRYGSAGRYGPTALGGFGLGLKTASLSQCRRLFVASRRTLKARPEIRLWDLDEVRIRDDWTLERLLPSESPEELLEPLREAAGTVVLWEALDRVMLYRNPLGLRAEGALTALRLEVAQHLAMVFHRFLAGEAGRATPLRILVNDEELAPWDPFARSEAETLTLPVHTMKLRQGRTDHSITARPYLLPSQHRFSSPEAHHAASGPRRWNRQQGLYVYRGDRLIQSGGWNRLRTQDEHTKLARVAVEFPQALDEAFGVNVSKMRVSLPESIRPAMRALVSAVSVRAQDRYRSHSADAIAVTTRDRGTSEPPLNGRPTPALLMTDADLIPRARVVQILRGELSKRPDILRRLVDAILSDAGVPRGPDERLDGEVVAPATSSGRPRDGVAG